MKGLFKARIKGFKWFF